MSRTASSNAVLPLLSGGVRHRIGLLSVICAGLLWGTGGVVVRLLHDHVALSPVSVAFYRLAVAVPVLLLFTWRRRDDLRAGVRTAPGLLLAIGVGLGAYQALYFVAVTAVGVAVATVICLGLAPVLLIGWEAARAGHRPERATVVTVGVAVLGLVLVSVAGMRTSVTSPQPVLGLLCAVGSGLGYAGATLLGRRAAATVAPLPLTAITTAVAAAVLAPLATVSGLGFPISAGPVLALAYLGPVTTALAFALFYLGLRTTATSTATVLTLLEPVAAAALATLVLHDPLPGTTIAGGVLILAAVTAHYRRGTDPRARR